MTTFAVLAVILSTAALVWAVAATSPAKRALKMLASTGFLLVAISAGALSTTYGRTVLVALALSWLGDLLLTFDTRRGFIGGLVSFLLGHAAYVIAFITLGVDPAAVLIAAAAVAMVGVFVWRWLSPHVGDMRAPVIAYVVVISAMVVAAFGAFGAGGTWLIPLGGVLFFISDLFVARNQFVSAGIVNRVWGLPIYYTAQTLLALTVTLAV